MKTKNKYIEKVVARHLERRKYEINVSEVLVKDNEEKVIRERKVEFYEPNTILCFKNLKEYSRRIVSVEEEIALFDYQINKNDIYEALIKAAAKARRNFPTTLAF